VIGQIVDRARLMSQDSGSTLSIKLKPEFLGDLNIVIEVERGSINAHFAANNPATANLIAARLPELRQALSDQGISWQHLSVSSSGGQGGGQGSHQGASSQFSFQSQQNMTQPGIQYAPLYNDDAGGAEALIPGVYQWTGAGSLNCTI
jgi:flagellar hook-length control protein FliK